MSYTPIFQKPYPDGWENLPSEDTPITAEALDGYDEAIVNIENYLGDNEIISVEANPQDASTDSLTKIEIDGTVYGITGGGGSSTFAGLSDVDFDNLQNGQVPVYNSTTEKWENGNGGGGASTLAGLLDVDIALPIGGQALVYDDVNDEWINATVSGASSLNDLSDVTISSATQGQVLMKGSSVWENASLSKSDVGLGNVDNTSDANKPVSTATQIAISNAHKVTNKAVDLTSWTTDTTSQSGTTLYKKQITLNHIYSAPSVDVGAASGSVLPTVAEQTAYGLLKYVTYDDTVPCLYLYASDIPSTAFYIDVEGVD